MARDYYIAIDLGATSGRIIAGFEENNEIKLIPIYRFNHEVEFNDGILSWNIKKIYENIIIGLKKCKDVDIIPKMISIDTWGCDFIVVKNNEEIIYARSYRHGISESEKDNVLKVISKHELYQKTYIHFQEFNSLYRMNNLQGQALFLVNYFNYLLTGKKLCDYTIASTSQLMDKDQNCYNEEILNKLKINKEYLPKLVNPGEYYFPIKNSISETIGYETSVLIGAGHDTANAFYFAGDNNLILNLGTWAIIGENSDKLVKTNYDCDITYERGLKKKYKILKTLPGLYGFEKLIKEFNLKNDYQDIIKEINKDSTIGFVNISMPEYFNTADYNKLLISDYKEKYGTDLSDKYQILRVFLNSLIEMLVTEINDFEKNTKNINESILIMGGGSKNGYLVDKLRKKIKNKKIIIGDPETTVKGNILFQIKKRKIQCKY